MTASPWEYKAVPAPARPRRIRGVKGREERFARTLEEVLGEEAVDGWEFLRAETLPVEERAGWFGGRRVEYRPLLIFRRARLGAGAPAAAEPTLTAGEPRASAGAAEPALRAAAPAASPDPDAAFGRSFARGAPPRPAEAPDPYPDPDPGRAAETRAEPGFRLSPSPDPDPDRRLHADPDAPRLGPADR